MIRDRIVQELRDGPKTLAQLSRDLGMPKAMLSSALMAEFYRQVEFDHPKHGPVTAWAVRACRIRVDSEGRYCLAVP